MSSLDVDSSFGDVSLDSLMVDIDVSAQKQKPSTAAAPEDGLSATAQSLLFSSRVTVSAFTETPFDFKVFEIGKNGSVEMKTVNLASEVSFPTRYDFDKTYVQGRPCDRSFSDPSS